MKLGNLSIKIFELGLFQDQNEWKHELLKIENCKKHSDKVTELLMYKNQYVLIKKLQNLQLKGSMWKKKQHIHMNNSIVMMIIENQLLFLKEKSSSTN